MAGRSRRLAPTVSVVMPVRDAVPYLEPAIRSILDQTLAELELIVVDDGSRDGSSAVIAHHARRDRRIRVLRQEARGTVAALQAGLAQARADLVARMDADDLALPRRLERQVAAMRENPRAAVIGSACELIDRQGVHLREQRYPTEPEAVRRTLEMGNCIAHPTVLMRKQAVLAAGGYRAPFVLCEDYDLWLRLSERHELLNLDEVLLRYRVHRGQSTWKSHEQRILSELAALACARTRRAGRVAPVLPEGAVDRAFLATVGLSGSDLARAVAGRALGAAEDGMRLKMTASALRAFALAATEPGLPLRWRAGVLRRFAGLMLGRQ